MRTLGLIALLLSACFSRPADGVIPIRCDVDNPCPEGSTCSGGLCSGTGPAADLGVSSWGCASGPGTGQLLTSPPQSPVYACPGTFGQGQARALCSTGWQVCTQRDPIPALTCTGLKPGFLLADVPAAFGTTLRCQLTSLDERLFMGCGDCTTEPCYLRVESCNGFQTAARDGKGGFDFSKGHNLDKAINSNPQNGVLCCKL